MDIKKTFKDFNFKYNPIYRKSVIDKYMDDVITEDSNQYQAKRSEHKGIDFTPEKLKYESEKDTPEFNVARIEFENFSIDYWREEDNKDMQGISISSKQRERSLISRKD